jgi:hypothetical protein
MSTIQNGQTCLEKRGFTERHNEIVRSDYNIENQYSAVHPDALSNGDPQGKGANHGGHSHFLPDCTKPSGEVNYSNFATSPTDQIGGEYDIEGYANRPGRRVQMARSLYNYEEPYGANLVNTTQNVNDGQYFVGQQIGQPKQ